MTHLKNENEFWRRNVFPSLSADEKEYQEYGGYWCGAVWAPTNVMIIKGLEKNGYEVFASEATEKYLTGMYEVYKETGTVYENYAPDHFLPGNPSKADFVGWTGCGPIQLLIENVFGLRPDGANNSLIWRLNRLDHHGVENLKLGNNNVSVICEERENKNSPATITVVCEKDFSLNVIHPLGTKSFELKKGKHILNIK